MNTTEEDAEIVNFTRNNTLIRVDDVINLLIEWEDAYPEDIFTPNGTSPDCIAAKMARHILKCLKREVAMLNKQ